MRNLRSETRCGSGEPRSVTEPPDGVGCRRSAATPRLGFTDGTWLRCHAGVLHRSADDRRRTRSVGHAMGDTSALTINSAPANRRPGSSRELPAFCLRHRPAAPGRLTGRCTLQYNHSPARCNSLWRCCKKNFVRLNCILDAPSHASNLFHNKVSKRRRSESNRRMGNLHLSGYRLIGELELPSRTLMGPISPLRMIFC